MNTAIVLAGGVGSRLGADQPKQFVEVEGKPVVAYTLERFQEHPEIDAIEIVCVKSHLEVMGELVRKYGFSKVRWVTEGGATFQESVIHGVEGLQTQMSPEDIVLIHYAASPFVSPEIISDGIRVAQEKGNCVSATPCYLLLGSNDDGTQSSQWVDRDAVMQLNSPQCFRYGYVLQLYREAEERGLLDKVEPHTTSLMYQMGRTIYFAKGSQSNIKITTKEDLELFAGYVLLQKRKSQTNDVEKALSASGTSRGSL